MDTGPDNSYDSSNIQIHQANWNWDWFKTVDYNHGTIKKALKSW